MIVELFKIMLPVSVIHPVTRHTSRPSRSVCHQHDSHLTECSAWVLKTTRQVNATQKVEMSFHRSQKCGFFAVWLDRITSIRSLSLGTNVNGIFLPALKCVCKPQRPVIKISSSSRHKILLSLLELTREVASNLCGIQIYKLQRSWN